MPRQANGPASRIEIKPRPGIMGAMNEAAPLPLKTKTPRDSQVESRYIVMPQHANDVGFAFGGTIMSWIDMVAAMVAQKHCEREVVTASSDRISFLQPIRIGDQVVLRASVNYVGRTSLEVGVLVTRENPFRNESVRATTAYLTLVALDEKKEPVMIHRLRPETPEEIRRFNHARLRVEARRDLHQKISQSGPAAV
jgi:acyl-CoA hydrolase